MIGVVIVPTGIGAELGGHAGDANPMLKLIGACCDKVITHPNVVNASDINEMPENCLYVEGSMLDRFLNGKIELRERARPNKILVVANPPMTAQTINAVNAACTTIGIDAQIVELESPLRMVSRMMDGVAQGFVSGSDKLINQIKYKYDFDVLAVHTPIEVDRDVALDYFRNGGTNPWGGVEAAASKILCNMLDKPVAHAPKEREEVEEDEELYKIFNSVVDPRMASEAVSVCYLHCVLKGLHRAPLRGKGGLNVGDVDFMISPWGCDGVPHDYCRKQHIPIIAVKENKTVLNRPIKGAIEVENYWEAVGVIMSMKAGLRPESVRRPFVT